MAPRIDTPSETVRQVSGNDPAGRAILSVLVKRTYSMSERGTCDVAEAQLPLRDEPEFDPGDRGILHDADLFPYKPRTDVVVKGHAYGYDGRARFQAAVQIGGASKHILVLGDRTCGLNEAGRLTMGPPGPVTRIPLSYTYAYGGRDAIAEALEVEDYLRQKPDIDPEFLPTGEGSPFLYPRNPCGRGYLMRATPAAVQALRLPNLEDPLDPLTPDRVEVERPRL